MSATSTNVAVQEPAGTTRRLSREAMVRFALVAVGVGVCYLFQWRWLRELTLVLNSWVDALAGIRLERVSFDTVVWRGAVYHYEIACTFADVWCGSLALIWRRERSLAWNVRYALLVGVVMIGFNVFRLSVSDVLFAMGLSWDVAHNVISGVSYFLVWTWIWRTKTFALREFVNETGVI